MDSWFTSSREISASWKKPKRQRQTTFLYKLFCVHLLDVGWQALFASWIPIFLFKEIPLSWTMKIKMFEFLLIPFWDWTDSCNCDFLILAVKYCSPHNSLLTHYTSHLHTCAKWAFCEEGALFAQQKHKRWHMVSCCTPYLLSANRCG